MRHKSKSIHHKLPLAEGLALGLVVGHGASILGVKLGSGISVTMFVQSNTGSVVTINGTATPSQGATITNISFTSTDGKVNIPNGTFPITFGGFATAGSKTLIATVTDSSGKTATGQITFFVTTAGGQQAPAPTPTPTPIVTVNPVISANPTSVGGGQTNIVSGSTLTNTTITGTGFSPNSPVSIMAGATSGGAPVKTLDTITSDASGNIRAVETGLTIYSGNVAINGAGILSALILLYGFDTKTGKLSAPITIRSTA